MEASAKLMIPLQRVGTPEDAAGAMLMLASPYASYITAQVCACCTFLLKGNLQRCFHTALQLSLQLCFGYLGSFLCICSIDCMICLIPFVQRCHAGTVIDDSKALHQLT